MRLTKVRFQKYLDLLNESKDLKRRASDLEKEADGIEADIVEHIGENGGKAQRCEFSGHALALVKANGSVPWSAEYIRLAGADAAEELRQKVVGIKTKLSIEPLK